MLAAAGYGFVLKSLPYRTPQLAPPRVRLTAEDLASLAQYPGEVRAVPVLGWRDVSYRLGNLVTTPVHFAGELAALRHDGFRSVSVGTLAALAAGRHVSLPARPIVLTFDDGLATDWTTVDPILQQYGFTAVVFINPQDVALKSPSYFLTHDELRAMAASGRWEVGLQLSGKQAPLSAVALQAADEPKQDMSAQALESLRKWRSGIVADAAGQQSKLQSIVGSPVTAYAWPVAITPDPANLKAPQVLYPLLKSKFDVAFGQPAGGPLLHHGRLGGQAIAAPGNHRREHPAGTRRKPAFGRSIPPPADPLMLPWSAGVGKCLHTGRDLKLRGHRFMLCTIVADGSEWQDYQLRLRIGFAKSANLTAIIELRLSTAGRIEVAIGRSGVSVEQLVGEHWSVLRNDEGHRPVARDGVTLSFLRAGSLPVRLSIGGTLLRVRVGSVTTEVRVSPAVSRGVIAVGLVSPIRRHSITYHRVRFAPVVTQTAAG